MNRIHSPSEINKFCLLFDRFWLKRDRNISMKFGKLLKWGQRKSTFYWIVKMMYFLIRKYAVRRFKIIKNIYSKNSFSLGHSIATVYQWNINKRKVETKFRSLYKWWISEAIFCIRISWKILIGFEMKNPNLLNKITI